MRDNWQWRDTMLSKSVRSGSRLFLGAVLVAIAVASGGCGGGDSSPPAQPAPRRPVQQPPQVNETPAPVKTPPAAAAQPASGTSTPGVVLGGRPGGIGATGREGPKPETKRSEDVSEWKTADYYNAKKENDPQLLEAVRYIAENEKSVGNETTALILIKLLTAEEPEKDSPTNKPPGEPGMGEPGMGGPVVSRSVVGRPGAVMGGYGARSQVPRLDRQTIEAVIIALTINGSKPAQKALRAVVLGTLKTDDDSVATRAALAALVENESPENEAVLFRALTEPEKLRPEEKAASTRTPHVEPGGISIGTGMGRGVGRGVGRGMGRGMGRGYGASGKLSADALRRMTLDVIEPVASEDFRLKLASHILDPDLRSATINVLSDMLIKPHPNNIGPQLLLFQSDEPDLATKARLAGFFTEYSETALGYFLGVLKHTKPFKFGEQTSETKPGSKRSRTGWGKQAGGTGWGSSPAGGERPRGTGTGVGLDLAGDGGMGGYTNRPGGKTLDTKQLMAADPEMPARIAKKLWSPEVTRVVGGWLAQASSPAEASLAIPLARTMPVDDVRACLHRLMQTHWEDGSRPFLSGVNIPTGGAMAHSGTVSGLGDGYGGEGIGGMGMPGGGLGGKFDKPVCDPGFLVLVKMLPANQKQNDGRRPRGGRQSGNGGGLSIGMPGGAAGTGGGSPVADWQKVHENLLYQFATAFQAAARLNRDARAVGTLPIEPHTNAGIDVRFDLKWPESAPKQSGLSLDPIEIHYVKISETADPAKVLKSYSRILKTKHRMLQPNRVALLDTIREGSTPGSKLSIDVLITIQQPGMAAPTTDRKSKKKAGEPLTVEILTIEIKDPNPPASRTKAEKPKR